MCKGEQEARGEQRRGGEATGGEDGREGEGRRAEESWGLYTLGHECKALSLPLELYCAICMTQLLHHNLALHYLYLYIQSPSSGINIFHILFSNTIFSPFAFKKMTDINWFRHFLFSSISPVCCSFCSSYFGLFKYFIKILTLIYPSFWLLLSVCVSSYSRDFNMHPWFISVCKEFILYHIR